MTLRKREMTHKTGRTIALIGSSLALIGVLAEGIMIVNGVSRMEQQISKIEHEKKIDVETAEKINFRAPEAIIDLVVMGAELAAAQMLISYSKRKRKVEEVG
ncbi:MAG: hypothetical protein Q7S22_07110 [Candidatus Micrarchaeota archaeon]|nr:hypothetical protein [Candidatus Micrarchaeota archaeon]